MRTQSSQTSRRESAHGVDDRPGRRLAVEQRAQRVVVRDVGRRVRDSVHRGGAARPGLVHSSDDRAGRGEGGGYSRAERPARAEHQHRPPGKPLVHHLLPPRPPFRPANSKIFNRRSRTTAADLGCYPLIRLRSCPA